MSKGTIIYIGGFELPDKNAAAHRVLNNGKALKELGYNVVYLSVDKNLDQYNSVMTTYKSIQSFDCWFIPYPKSTKHWIKYLSSIEYFNQIYNKYSDVKGVICYNYQSMAFLKLKRFCKKNNIKLYADITEWYGIKGYSSLPGLIKKIDTFIRMRVIHKKLDGLIVISNFLDNYYTGCSNVIIVPPLVDFSEEKWGVRKTDKSYNDKIKLVYSGSPGSDKDKINLIIRSLHLIKNEFDYIYCVVGISEEEYLSFYPEDNLILREMQDKIRFLGRITHKESLKCISDSDFSIFIREANIVSKAGFPTKLVESISCGTPVITNSTSDIKQYIVEGKTGFIVNGESVHYLSKDLKKVFLNFKSNEKSFKMEYMDTFNYKKYIKEFKGLF